MNKLLIILLLVAVVFVAGCNKKITPEMIEICKSACNETTYPIFLYIEPYSTINPSSLDCRCYDKVNDVAIYINTGWSK